MKCEYCNKEFKHLEAHQKNCSALDALDNKEKKELIDNTNSSADKRKEIMKKEQDSVETKPGLEAKVNALTDNLNTLAGAVNKLVQMQKKPPVQPEITPKQEPEKDETIDNSYLPPKFREIVNNILSPEFGAKVTDFEDRVDFQFTIIVPQKYSSLSKDEYEQAKGDIRSRIIPRGLGENGIKEWCKLIRLNLNKYFTKEGVKSPFENN